ncbi:class I SAM-dependent methyltransferase [Bacillus sp. H-16]|nr:class I SAM-dependent methyltransferase [Alteribacter salitolerans]
MMEYGSTLFKGTASYYSRCRPLYPASLVRFAVKRFGLDGTGRMLDAGCGPGQLACRFSDWFETITGIDTEEEMIDEASRLSKENRVDNAEWIHSDAETFVKTAPSSFRLVIIAKAFHWMDRRALLDSLYPKVSPGGGVIIIDEAPPKSRPLWKGTVNDVVEEWYGSNRRAGKTTYSHPEVSHEEVIEDSRFTLEVHELPPFQVSWTVDVIIGYLYSTSYGRKAFLGEKVEAFEGHMREALMMIDPSGVFKETITLKLKLAIKKGGTGGRED